MAIQQSLSNLTPTKAPRSNPQTLQAKVDETFHSLNRATNTAHRIIQHLDGQQGGTLDKSSSPVAACLQTDAEANYAVAYELEDLLERIEHSLGVQGKSLSGN